MKQGFHSSKNSYGSKTTVAVDGVIVSFILAKIHMVAKQLSLKQIYEKCFILAKIHMVAKQAQVLRCVAFRFILAKIHMVAKPQKYYNTPSEIRKYLFHHYLKKCSSS